MRIVRLSRIVLHFEACDISTSPQHPGIGKNDVPHLLALHRRSQAILAHGNRTPDVGPAHFALSSNDNRGPETSTTMSKDLLLRFFVGRKN